MAGKAAQEDAPTAVVDEARRPSTAPPRPRRTARALPWPAASLRAHWLFLLLLTAGVALRTVTFLAYQPALFSPDSRLYLEESESLEPPANWPIGYPAFLRLLPLGIDLAVIPFVQHLFGLAIAAVIYVLLLRLGVRRWLSALATAPVLLDAYQLNIEQYVLSEVLFDLFLVAAAATLLWRRPLGTAAAGIAGLLFAAAALTRGVGVLAAAAAVLTVLFLGAGMPLRARLSRVAVFLALFAAVLGGYVLWFHSIYGSYSLAGSAGRRFYGRVAPWVDCSEFSMPSYERVLCPEEPVGSRPRVVKLVWAKSSPVNRVEPPPGMTRNHVARNFARRAILHQPVTYARVVASDFVHTFWPTKEPRPGGYRVAQWQFQVAYPIPGYSPGWSPSPPPGFEQGKPDGDVRRSLASFLRTYQSFGYTPGPLLGLGLVASLVAALGVGRARRSGLRSAAFLFSGIALALSLGTIAAVPFSWRHQLPQLILLPPATVVAITALARKGGRESGSPEEVAASRRAVAGPA